MEIVPGIPVRPSLFNSQTPIMKRVETKIPTPKINTEFVSLKNPPNINFSYFGIKAISFHNKNY